MILSLNSVPAGSPASLARARGIRVHSVSGRAGFVSPARSTGTSLINPA